MFKTTTTRKKSLKVQKYKKKYKSTKVLKYKSTNVRTYKIQKNKSTTAKQYKFLKLQKKKNNK